MLWLKSFHLISMVTWFAGLFYLPRLFIYHLQAREGVEAERFQVMEKKLSMIMNIGAVLTIALGLALLGWYGKNVGGEYFRQGWLHAKLALVLALIGYHGYCQVIMANMRRGNFKWSDRWLRWFNEVPALALVGIVILVVVKPF